MAEPLERTYIPAIGNSSAQIMILGESPGHEELVAGKPFIGPSGRELDSLLKDAGITRSQTWISNVCKYFVTPNVGTKKIPFQVRAKNDGIDLDSCISELQYEINQVKPNVILALGGTALWALTGKKSITNYRGSILFGMGRKVVATYHPAHLLHQASGAEFKGYWNRQVMVLDMKRAKLESETLALELPSRNLQICRSSAQLQDFIDRYKNHSRPAVDIEAAGLCIPSCIGFAFTPYEGLTIPFWPNDAISIPDSEYVQFWLLINHLLMNNDIVGQNFKYDQDKLLHLGFKIRSLASDTLLKSFTISPELPKSLGFNTSIRTREPFYKNEGMYEGSFHDLMIGCARDSCVTKEIDLSMDTDIDELELRDFYNNFIIQLHELYLGVESEGFCIDKEARDRLFDKYVRWSERLSYEIYQLTESYVNVNSPKQVSILLFDVLKLPRRGGTGEEELTALLSNQGRTGVHNEKHRRALECILEKRRVDKTINTYLKAMPDFDGKMKTSYFLCLETGRTATSQLEPPIRPVLDMKNGTWTSRKKAGRDYRNIGTAFQTITKHGDIGEDIRSQYIPEPGYIFLQADSAQAEARVVFLLADDEQALKDIDIHDYHALTASWFFGGVESDYSKKVLGYESPIRFAGKTLRHAGHLGAGKRRASIELNTQARKYKIPIAITEQVAERALKIFHMKQPKIREVFHKGIIESLQRDKRYLTASVPYGIDSKYGGKRLFFERWGDELFRVAFSYIPQRAISDNTKAAMLRIKAREPKLTRIILEAHDGILFMIPEKEVDYYAPIVKEEMERPIRFDTCSMSRRNLVIPCDIEVGHNYQEFKKFKIVPILQKDIKEVEQLEIKIPVSMTERFKVIDLGD